MAGDFVDERGYATQIFDYLTSGSSPSEFRGAYENIDKMISEADAKAELAKLFQMQAGRENIGVYRHLNPSDSTVTLLMGLADQYYRKPGVPMEELLRASAMGSKDSPVSMTEAARMLAKKRNQ